MNKPQDSTSYAGSAIVFPRRTAGQPAQPTRKRSTKQSEPNYQQGHTFGIHPADEPYDTDSFDVEGADYPGEPVRRRTSAVYQPTAPSRRETTRLQAKPTKVIRQHRFDRTTLVIWLCLALIVMVGGWWLLSTVAYWWTGVQENIKYGTPWRTFQADQYVGLGDSPAHPDHFIALNLHGVIEVIQINPQDRSKDAVYVLASVGDSNVPASLSFRDTTGSGHTDVIVTIGDSTPYTMILLNTGKALVPTQPTH